MNKPAEYSFGNEPSQLDLLILAAGFEERAFHFLSNSTFNSKAWCVLIGFENDVPKNNEVYKKYKKEVDAKFESSNIFEVTLKANKLSKYESDLSSVLSTISEIAAGIVWVDISGMPTHIICSTLNVCRQLSSSNSQAVIYTSAKEYHPTEEEYNELKVNNPSGIEFLPKSMAREMSEVLMLQSFSGHRSKEGVSCLAVFAGYEVHRTAGVIDNINPSMLLLLYGKPGDEKLRWRLDLSRSLHRKFESTRRTAVEEVSTLHLNESIEVLELYYQYLFEDYDFTIAPVCSKMQVVATFLFWERYREVQLVFPLPIGYATELSPKGVGRTFITELEPRNSLYRQVSLSSLRK